MERPISKYLDHMLGVDAEACLRAERRDRDFTLLRAIRTQSFALTRPAYLHAESTLTAVHAHTDMLFANIVRRYSRTAVRAPIPCSPTPNCRGHPCSPA